MKYIVTILALSFSLCQSQGQSCNVDGIVHSSFQDIQLILDNNQCNSCHKDQNIEGNWQYDTYNAFLQSGDCGTEMIIHGDASNSYFFQKLIGGEIGCNETNGINHFISNSEISQIESWINFGAPEFCIPLFSEVKSLLDANNCNSCHGNEPNMWRYDSYITMIDSDLDESCDGATIIVKGNSAESFLYDKINDDGYVACGEPMNAGSSPMGANDIARIRDWINSGAYETAASLPVVLSQFDAIQQLDEVVLTWVTEEEIATEKFVIEHSASGRNFTAISEMPTQGNSLDGFEYEYIDQNPSIGQNYYRLKILDLDGSFKYSNIRFVRIKSTETTISVFPNPAVSRERLTVKWLPRGDEESTYLNIVDVNGQSLHRKIIFEGTNYVRLPYLLDGVYYIIVEDLFGGFLLERVVIIN